MAPWPWGQRPHCAQPWAGFRLGDTEPFCPPRWVRGRLHEGNRPFSCLPSPLTLKSEELTLPRSDRGILCPERRNNRSFTAQSALAHSDPAGFNAPTVPIGEQCPLCVVAAACSPAATRRPILTSRPHRCCCSGSHFLSLLSGRLGAAGPPCRLSASLGSAFLLKSPVSLFPCLLGPLVAPCS